jgi:3-hydroxyisobutyrate dehydrogenase
MDKPHIGFIGLGIMGTPMSKHLAEAGYDLSLFDLTPDPANELATNYKNVSVAENPKVVAGLSDIVITMLPSGRPVQEVALGDNGLIHGFKPGSLLLDTSSSEPDLTIETAKALKEKGVDMVDAPVSGAQWGAEAAELVFMVGGKKESVSRIRPLLNIMGNRIFHLGPVGAGHTMKSINNLITAITFLATTEGLIIGKKSGLDPEVMTDVLNESTGMSWISQTQIKQRITSRKFDDPFKLALMFKDVNIAVNKARDLGVDIPLSFKGRDIWEKAEEFADRGASISEMVKYVEDKTGTKIVK